MDEDKKPKSFTEQISSSFFKGLLIVVPPAITVFVITWLFEVTENTIGKYLPAKIPGAGLVIVLVAIWIVGVLSGNFLSKKILEFFDGLIGKIPVVKFIYKSVKQVSKAVFESDSMFKSVVLVPYQKSYVMGFQILRRLRLRLYALEHEHDGRHEFLREKIRRDSPGHVAPGRPAIYFDGGHDFDSGSHSHRFK